MIRPIFPVVDYVINQNYISEFLCINKEKPELQCEGKCYLMQMLQEQEKKRHQDFPKINMEDYPIGFVEFLDCPAGNKNSGFSTNIPEYFDLYDFLFIATNFHPPNSIS